MRCRAASSPSARATALASRYASQARKALPNEPLTHLLRAQTAQLTGDRTTSRRIFEAMLASRGYRAARSARPVPGSRARGRDGSRAPVRRARRRSSIPSSAGPSKPCSTCSAAPATGPGALETLAIARRNGLRRQGSRQAPPRRPAHRPGPGRWRMRRSDKALELALEAHGLAPRPRARWRHRRAHPGLARKYAARRPRAPRRPGASPRIPISPPPTPTCVPATARATASCACAISAASRPATAEAPIAIAVAAIEAREWDEARQALEPLLDGRLTQRVVHAHGPHRGRPARPLRAACANGWRVP